MRGVVLFGVVCYLIYVQGQVEKEVMKRSRSCSRRDSWKCLLRDTELDCKHFKIKLNSISDGDNFAQLDLIDSLLNWTGSCRLYPDKNIGNVESHKMLCQLLEKDDIFEYDDRNLCKCTCKILSSSSLKMYIKKLKSKRKKESCVVPVIHVTGNLSNVPVTVNIFYNSSSSIYSELSVRFLRYSDGLNGNCSDLKNNVVFRHNYGKAREDQSLTFNLNLNISGNYCIRVGPSEIEKCEHPHDYKFTLFDPPKSLSSSLPDENVNTKKSILSSVLAIFLIVIIFAIGFCQYRRKKNVPEKINGNTSPSVVSSRIIPNTKVETKSVLLIYDRRNSDHNKAVKLFSELLEKYFFCNVSYEIKEQEKVIISESEWMNEKLKADNVIIVNSHEAFLRQQDFLGDGSRPLPSDQPFLDTVFDRFIGIVESDISNWGNYKQFIHVRFPYTSREHVLKHIVSDVHYEIPAQFRQLFVHVHSLDAKLVDDFENFPSTWKNDNLYAEFSDILLKVENGYKITNKNPDDCVDIVSEPLSSSSNFSLESELESESESADSKKNLITTII